MVAPACNQSIREAEAGGSGVEGQPELHETVLKIKPNFCEVFIDCHGASQDRAVSRTAFEARCGGTGLYPSTQEAEATFQNSEAYTEKTCPEKNKAK